MRTTHRLPRRPFFARTPSAAGIVLAITLCLPAWALKPGPAPNPPAAPASSASQPLPDPYKLSSSAPAANPWSSCTTLPTPSRHLCIAQAASMPP